VVGNGNNDSSVNDTEETFHTDHLEGVNVVGGQNLFFNDELNTSGEQRAEAAEETKDEVAVVCLTRGSFNETGNTDDSDTHNGQTETQILSLREDLLEENDGKESSNDRSTSSHHDVDGLGHVAHRNHLKTGTGDITNGGDSRDPPVILGLQSIGFGFNFFFVVLLLEAGVAVIGEVEGSETAKLSNKHDECLDKRVIEGFAVDYKLILLLESDVVQGSCNQGTNHNGKIESF